QMTSAPTASASPVCTTLRPNVDLIEWQGRRFYLVGTAHISHSSVELTEEMIRSIRPDAVAVELCQSRFQALRDPQRWKNTDIVEVIRSGRSLLLIAQLLLAAFQRKLGKEINIKPGAEMLHAVGLAEELGIPIVLADREIKTTLKRTWAALTFLQRIKLLIQVPTKAIVGERIDSAEIEQLKEKDALDSALRELAQTFPGVQTALIDERDRYLASKIRDSQGSTVMAILGAGHIPGIRRYLDQPIDRAALETLPPPSKIKQLVGWGLSVAIVGLIVHGFLTFGTARGMEMAASWIVITGASAALGSALVFSHPLTVLVAFVGGPIAALAPVVRPGWFAGLSEAILRKPKVADLEAILDDLSSLRGIWRNRLSRILLIIILTNILGGVGALLAIGQIASLAGIVSSGG
ncbi:MAG: TraB/GumN family protein, partial [Proteobacteria bacterium]|nr:TraB/GumN family protein [Pseudomonadota bacterium]